ncbi:putative quinol monooxygenase [Pontibacter silvestris]|uniref:Quinol monooxygenase n=1 Tax=Pontibacter silvestris TaxID=2305183 RepID=A0ABW4X0A1_9BACT|nr:putative quinol monooxygenase [Pontibacter silvestris]MCC9138466.1 antibiotic biosynthesis monooxygenase [Pontibacter silvestris]
MLYITAAIKVKPEAIEALTDIFEPLVTATRREQGCHRYEAHRPTDDPATIIMLEEWQSEESIQAHNQSEHFQQFITSIEPLLAEPLQIYITQKFF